MQIARAFACNDVVLHEMYGFTSPHSVEHIIKMQRCPSPKGEGQTSFASIGLIIGNSI
jgi:hypothetical protein